MNSRLLRIFALLLMGLTNTAFAQLGPQWFGTWKNQDGNTHTTMTISASKIEFTVVRPDEQGKPETFNFAHLWTNRSDDAAGELTAVFGYAKKRFPLPEISRNYEEALRQYRRDPSDFHVSDPARSRQAIGAMSPGVYKVMWSYSDGDCGYDEYVIDGDKILDVNTCKYRFNVKLFNRVR